MASEEQVKTGLVERVGEASFVERLAQRIGGSARASAVFGEAVKRGDLKVIPVARATWAFGGGSGTSPEGSGGGGGGAGRVTPLGYIEVREDGAVYKPIPSRAPIWAAAAALGIAGLKIARELSRR